MSDVAILRRLKQRLDNMILRGVVKAVNSAAKMQSVQIVVLKDDPADSVEQPEMYGFTAHPKPGAEAFVVHVGGFREHGLVLAVADRRYRLTGLAEGEVALYDDLGQKVHLTREGIVVSSPLKVRCEAQDLEFAASRSLKWDVDGFGRKITSLGAGAYEDKTWQEGADVTPVSGPIAPPEGP